MTPQENLNREIDEFEVIHNIRVYKITANLRTIKALQTKGVTSDLTEDPGLIDNVLFMEPKDGGIKKKVATLFL